MSKFQPEHIDEDTLLGKGRFGEVFPYQEEQQDWKWAVKRIHAGTIKALLACLREIVLGFACDHPCIVPVKEYFIERILNSKSSFYIFVKMPRMKETLLANLNDKKRENHSYSEEEIIRHFYSLAHGIGYLHSKEIYHGDIKPDNLLMDYNGSLKIADVGITKRVEEEDPYRTPTGLFSAPEIIGTDRQKTEKDILTKADLWSLGMVILKLCAFNSKLLNAALPQKLQEKIEKSLEEIEGKYSVALITLIKKLLSFDPNERPDIEEIKGELEKKFSRFLDKDLVDLNKVDTTDEINILNEKIQEISEKFETESKELKDLVSQLERSLAEQKEQHEDKVKELIEQDEGRAREILQKEATYRLDQERIVSLEKELHNLQEKHEHAMTSKDENLKHLKEEIQKLQQEKSISDQRNKNLETTVKDQAKNYEDQIRALQESQLQLNQEKEELLTSLKSLQNKVEQLQKSLDDNYQRNLEKVASEQSVEWRSLFCVGLDEKILKIRSRPGSQPLLPGNRDIKDEHFSPLSKDIIVVNHLLNPEGLEIHCHRCEDLTDESFKHLATGLSTQSLNLKSLYLNFSGCRRLTVNSLVHLANALCIQSLQSFHLKVHSAKAITPELEFNFKKAIKKSHPNLQSLEFKFGDY